MSRYVARGTHNIEMIRNLILSPKEKPAMGVTMLDDFDDLGRSMDLRALMERNPIPHHAVQQSNTLSPQQEQEEEHDEQEMTSVCSTTADSVHDGSVMTKNSWGKCDIGDIVENTTKVEKRRQFHLQRIQRPREKVMTPVGELSEACTTLSNSRRSSWGSQESQDIDELIRQQSISLLSPQLEQEMPSSRRISAGSAHDSSIITESSWGKCDIGDLLENTLKVEKKMQSHLQHIQRPRKKLTTPLGGGLEAPHESFNNSSNRLRQSSWGSVDIEELIERRLSVELRLEKTLTLMGNAA